MNPLGLTLTLTLSTADQGQPEVNTQYNRHGVTVRDGYGVGERLSVREAVRCCADAVCVYAVFVCDSACNVEPSTWSESVRCLRLRCLRLRRVRL